MQNRTNIINCLGVEFRKVIIIIIMHLSDVLQTVVMRINKLLFII